jgi:Ca2+-dependent lipid-binding protein
VSFLVLPCQLYNMMQITGGSDPYVVATLGDSSATTAVRWGDLSPSWDEMHTLYVTNAEKDVLRLRVIDKNKLISDVDLGVVMMPVAALIEQQGQQLELELKGRRHACLFHAMCKCACVFEIVRTQQQWQQLKLKRAFACFA